MDYKKDYNEVIDSNIGKFYYKGYSKMYMDDNMKISLNTNNSLLRLTGDNSGRTYARIKYSRFQIIIYFLTALSFKIQQFFCWKNYYTY